MRYYGHVYNRDGEINKFKNETKNQKLLELQKGLERLEINFLLAETELLLNSPSGSK